MERRLLLEGDDIDELLRRVREDHGQEARIVNAEEKLVGGVRGFFAKRRYEVAVTLDEAGDGRGHLEGSDVTPGPSVQRDDGARSAHRAPAESRRTAADDALERRPRPITSLEELVAHASQLDGAPRTPEPPAGEPAPFEPTAYRRPSTPRHAAPVDASVSAHQESTDAAARSTVFDELMRDLTARAADGEVPDVRRPAAPEPAVPTRRSSRVAASYQAHSAASAASEDTAAALPRAIADVLDAVAGPERHELPAPLRWQPDSAPQPRAGAEPPPPQPDRQQAAQQAVQQAGPQRPVHPAPVVTTSAPAPAVAAPSYAPPSYAAPSYAPPSYAAPSYAAPSYAAPSYAAPSYAPAYDALPAVSPLVALGMPAPQADPRIALLDLLAGVAVRPPQSLSGVHVVVGDPAAIRALAGTWLRHCAADESAALAVAPAGSCDGDWLAAVRGGLARAIDLDGGALVLVDAGPSRAQARRAARQVEAVRALVGDSVAPAGGLTVSVTAVLDARWDVETTDDWLGALTARGTRLDDLGAHGVSESAAPLRLLGHGLPVSWLDAAPATLGCWAGPCLDRMSQVR